MSVNHGRYCTTENMQNNLGGLRYQCPCHTVLCGAHKPRREVYYMAPGFTKCRTYYLPLLRFMCTPLSCPVLTLFCRSVLAPARRSSFTTLWWPLKLARFSAVSPFCIVEWMRVTRITVDSNTPSFDILSILQQLRLL